ncbi:MAG TPA: NAD(P)/FAD-dependent oxidoreductase [Methylocystis sp.]|nr:NAD(P)/FAD-dependent oxidoreductase [Methylocystis sp.]
MERDDIASRPRIVIIGGGFAGIAAAQALEGSGARILILDGQNHHCFQPLLYQVATGALATTDIAWPIRYVMRNREDVTVLMLEAQEVDPSRKHVKTRDGEIPYDFLIIATGSTHSYFGHDAWAEHAPGLKSVEDAIVIRGRLLRAFEQAEACVDPAQYQKLLTFIIIGGGPTGVELAGAIAEVARRTLPAEFRRADPRDARIILLEAGPRILPSYPERLSTYALEVLSKMGVEVRTHTAVETVSPSKVIAAQKAIEAGAIFWAAGVKASPAAHWLGVAGDRSGRISVAPDLTVPMCPDVYVVGDLARVNEADGAPVPQLAASAKQMGRYTGRSIKRRLRGEQAPPEPFRYKDEGSLATIGRNSAIVKLGRLELTGVVGWLFWSVVHVYFLINLRSRLLVAMSWVAAYLTYHRGARIILDQPQGATKESKKDPPTTKR